MKPEFVRIGIVRAADDAAGPGLSIMSFLTRGSLDAAGNVFEREPSDANIESEIAKSEIRYVEWYRLQEEDIPQDRTFRDAWVRAPKGIGVDMPKARGIYRARLREFRAPLLYALDVQYQRADETGDKASKAAVAQAKQRLRDAPEDPRIEACSTVEELMAIDVLNG